MARILLVDDEAAVRGTMRRILERAGHEVDEASDGRRGIARFRAAPADLVVTDIFMPNEDGLEFIREIRHEKPRPKIIVVSGGDATGLLDMTEHARLLGAQQVLRKPFEMTELIDAVDRALRET